MVWHVDEMPVISRFGGGKHCYPDRTKKGRQLYFSIIGRFSPKKENSVETIKQKENLKWVSKVKMTEW